MHSMLQNPAQKTALGLAFAEAVLGRGMAGKARVSFAGRTPDRAHRKIKNKMARASRRANRRK